MKINNLRPAKGARTPKRRKGRGIGSGLGKTAGKGHKGQQSRTGSKQYFGFEGGQMPLIRRMPKVGFTSQKRFRFSIVNLESLNAFKGDTLVNPSLLSQKNLIPNAKIPVKILGKGALKKKLKVSAHAFSASAKEAIEKAGGTTEQLKV
ncbi:MAG: 50S ribosomal protein L15 [Candidatus Omnitrophica bacterium]|nr:50S ribosomal protein L15 [Candidatus Omnitrophota bacterium]